jgi:hypothetical protein
MLWAHKISLSEAEVSHLKKLITALCAIALGAAFFGRPVLAAGTPEAVAHPYFNTLPANIDVEATRAHVKNQMMLRPDAFVGPASWILADSSTGLYDPWNKVNYGDIYFLGAVPPTTAKTVDSNLGIYIISWKFKFSNGLVTDPETPSCADTSSVLSRFEKSPLFNNYAFASNGVALGSRQYIDAFQAAELHGFVPTTYHTNFIDETTLVREVTITVPKADGFAGTLKGCARPAGEISQAWFDKVAQAEIQALKFSHALIAFNLFNNTVMYGATTSDCCIIGYHSAYGTKTYTQVYGVGSYISTAWGFKGLEDTAALSHELGEAVNDPYVNNPTPAWGHIGQVSACQNNFEVGDPLSGTEFSEVLNGYTYHLQDLAFFSWFYRGTPANGLYLGTGGKYSFRGTLTSANLQKLCT